jgi:hypothetical protein
MTSLEARSEKREAGSNKRGNHSGSCGRYLTRAQAARISHLVSRISAVDPIIQSDL